MQQETKLQEVGLNSLASAVTKGKAKKIDSLEQILSRACVNSTAVVAFFRVTSYRYPCISLYTCIYSMSWAMEQRCPMQPCKRTLYWRFTLDQRKEEFCCLLTSITQLAHFMHSVSHFWPKNNSTPVYSESRVLMIPIVLLLVLVLICPLFVIKLNGLRNKWDCGKLVALLE